jgi:hypothetical protein
MLDTLDSLKDQHPGELLAGLRDIVRKWQGGCEPMDDETIVVVQRDAGSATSSIIEKDM